MKVSVQKLFEKDVSNIIDKKLATQLNKLIEDLEKAQSLSEIKHVEKMKAKGNYYRIRLGAYRVGIKAEGDRITLLRFLLRKEIYRNFPP